MRAFFVRCPADLRLFGVLLFLSLWTLPEPIGAQSRRVPRLESFELRGALEPKAARPLILRALPGLVRCFEEAEEEPTGALGVRLLIVSDGSVLAGEIDSSSIDERSIERCLLERLRAIRFPRVGDFEESHLRVRIGFEKEAAEARAGDKESSAEGGPPSPERIPLREVKLSFHLRKGALDETQEAQIDSRLGRIAHGCQQQAARRASGTQRGGRISFRLKVRGDGNLDALDVLYSNAASRLESCLLERTSRLVFPPAEVELDVQFLFMAFD